MGAAAQAHPVRRPGKPELPLIEYGRSVLDPRLDLLRLTGLVGIAATAVLTAADLIMLYTPRPSSAFRIAEVAPALSRRRVLLGEYRGIFKNKIVLVCLKNIH